MPVFRKSQLERVDLPSTINEVNEADRAYVEIKTDLRAGDLFDLSKEGLSTSEQGIMFLTKIIAGWNYTQEDGSPLPINEDTVAMLDIADFVFLTEKIGDLTKKLTTLEKKTSTDTSTVEPAAILSSL